MKCFVSYTTRDKEITKELLSNFADKLMKFGEVFIDIINNNSEDKQARVISELDNSDLLILIKTKSIYKSKWVSLEIERANSKKIPIRGILVEDLKNINEVQLREFFAT